jgi:hypothetical protein
LAQKVFLSFADFDNLSSAIGNSGSQHFNIICLLKFIF